jgi:class 3 adenylate cyclase/ankyrin repeat protein
LQVGGEHGRYEYVIAGTPMEQIAIAEPLAGSGETVLSPDTWKEVVHTVVEGERLTADGSEGYHRLAAFDTEQHTYPTVKQAALECTRIEASRMAVVEDAVMLRQSARFIPRAVLQPLRSGNSTSVNEMRSVTIIFVQIGGVDVSTVEGSKIAQQLMVSMQRACYNLEGNLNKFLVDDKGLLFLFVFGLPPVVHIDDPARAIAACFDMVSALKSMNLVGRFGVTTGRVFCGIVGSNKRREYTVMGDTVNLSARLMANAPENSVLIDEATYLRSRRDISCDKLDPIRVKGKSNAIPIFAPHIPKVHGLAVSQLRKALGQLGWNLDQTQLQVPIEGGQNVAVTMPWRALSYPLGGPSPILKLSRWRDLQRVDQLLAEPRGLFSVGGSLSLSGPTGIGKQELSEHLIHKGMYAGLFPLFAFQRTRDGEEWRALAELVQDCLLILSQTHQKAHGAKVGDIAESLLENVVKPDDNIRRVLAFLGFKGFEAPNAKDSLMDGGSNVLEAGAVRLGMQLVEAVAEHRGVLVTLRIRRGTDVYNALESSGRSSLFWALSVELSKMAVQRRRQILNGSTLKPILVVTVSRTPGISRNGSSMTPESDKTLNFAGGGQTPSPIAAVPTPQQEGRATFELALNPLTDDAAVELMCHSLGLSTADGGALVTRRLREFVSAVSINVPAYIQDCVEQLLTNSAVSVSGGECKAVVADLNAVNIAEWVHTSMVGGTISTLESLGQAKQHIMKMATVFEGPFSPLDLAATNRVLYGRLPKTLSFYDMSKLLSSCCELVKQGLLKRVTQQHATPADRAPAQLPRWTISNTLVRRVAGSMVLNSYRILLKRAVLIERALNVWLPKRMGVAQAKGDKKRPERINRTAVKGGKTDDGLPKVASGYARSPFAPLESEEVSAMSEDAKHLLCQGCLLGNLNVVFEILSKDESFDVTFTGVGGYTPLHFACSNGQVDIVSLLCDHGAVVDTQSDNMETPLLVAALRGHLEVVQYLCETQRALTASLRDSAYWEKMLSEIQSEEEIPSPLSEASQAPKYSHEVLNSRRKEIVTFLKTQFEEFDATASQHSMQTPVRQETEASSCRPSLSATDSEGEGEKTPNGTTPSTSPNAGNCRRNSGSGKDLLGLPSLTAVFKNTLSMNEEHKNMGKEDPRQAHAIVDMGSSSKGLDAGVKKVKSGNYRDLRTKIRLALRSRTGMVFTLVALSLALYMPDIWVVSGAPSNTGIDVTLTIVMLMFAMELVLLSLVDSSYPLSFFFFMDCVGPSV